MPPKERTTSRGTRAQRDGAPKKGRDAAANRAIAPTVKDVASKKMSTASKISPAKISPAKKSPAKTSPAKKTASPRKETVSPEKKPAAYKTTMTRATRATSTAPTETSSTIPPKHVKNVFQKRGPLGTQDNDDDPTQPTDEMLAAFDKQSLTEMDQHLIHGITYMEHHEDAEMTTPAYIIVDQEDTAESEGRPLDCHTKIYWRFLDLWSRRHAGLYPREFFKSRGRHNTLPPSPAKRIAKATSRSPSKATSPGKGSPASGMTTSLRRSPERPKAPTSRPLRSTSSKGLWPSSRVTSDQVAGTSRIAKNKPSAPTRGLRSRIVADGDVAEDYRGGETDGVDVLGSFEDAAYEAAMDGKGVPALPRRLGVPKADVYMAQARGRARAISVLQTEEVNETIMMDSEEDFVPIVDVGKPRATSRTQPHSYKGRQSSAKQSPIRKVSVAIPTNITPVDYERGRLVSSQNPAKIKVKRGAKMELQDNPFFESMPGPEVWHRRMPPVFPFGETPYTARVVSDQINADLSRSHADDGKAAPPAQGLGIISGIRQMGSSVRSSIVEAMSPNKAAASVTARANKITSTWDLPAVDESYRQRIREVAEEFRAANHAARKKRPAPVDSHGPPQKRPRGARRGDRPLYA